MEKNKTILMIAFITGLLLGLIILGETYNKGYSDGLWWQYCQMQKIGTIELYHKCQKYI